MQSGIFPQYSVQFQNIPCTTEFVRFLSFTCLSIWVIFVCLTIFLPLMIHCIYFHLQKSAKMLATFCERSLLSPITLHWMNPQSNPWCCKNRDHAAEIVCGMWATILLSLTMETAKMLNLVENLLLFSFIH